MIAHPLVTRMAPKPISQCPYDAHKAERHGTSVRMALPSDGHKKTTQ
jgi:hypothetical protein